MGAPSPAAGWYPDPTGKPMQRYFNGTEWTDHYAAATPQAAGVITVGGENHVFHAVFSLITCGLWLPVWLIIALNENKKARTVDVYGNVIQAPATPREPGEAPPSAMPAWIDGLPGNPWIWIGVLVAVLVTLGTALAIVG